MPFSIIRNDITKVTADAIVNTANPHAVIGSGTDYAIYHAAGKDNLLAERRKIGDIAPGKAAATPAFALDAKYIIHTVGPAWIDGGHGEQETLRSCYEKSLGLAKELRCRSIAFPLISSGVYGFPKDLAISTATSAIYGFLMHNDMTVYLVVFDSRAYDLSGKLFKDVEAFIDENYVAEQKEKEYSRGNSRSRVHLKDHFVSLDEHIKTADKSFVDCLYELMSESGMKNPEIYGNALISKQTFSKIISGAIATPKKTTICALALGMHLDLEQTKRLLESAGYTLSKSSKFDLCIEYFLINKEYNITKNNIILESYGLAQL